LAPNFPKGDLVVSQQHRILANSKIIARMYEKEEILVAAKDLLQLKGVEVI